MIGGREKYDKTKTRLEEAIKIVSESSVLNNASVSAFLDAGKDQRREELHHSQRGNLIV